MDIQFGTEHAWGKFGVMGKNGYMTPDEAREEYSLYHWNKAPDQVRYYLVKKGDHVERYSYNPTTNVFTDCNLGRVYDGEVDWSGSGGIKPQRAGIHNFCSIVNLIGQSQEVTLTIREGRGYSGGHNTAERLGWHVSHPDAPPHSVLWWDSSTQGRFTGYYPSTTALCLKTP